MSDDVAPSRKVVQFPPPEQITDEERNRRIMLEVAHLAGQPAGSWKLWYRGKAEQLGIEPEKLAELIGAQIAANEKAAAEKLAQDKLEEQKAERERKAAAQKFREQIRSENTAKEKAKTKAKTFADIATAKLPVGQQDTQIAELAKQLGEDPDTLAAEFAEYRGAETDEIKSSDWEVEPWPEPIATAVVLEELIATINRHIAAQPHEIFIVALWFMFAWVHDAAHWSVYLVITAPDKDCGKSTLVVDIGTRLLPRPAPMGGKVTEATLFRLTDAKKCTVILDNADELFQKDKNVNDLFVIAWTRGVPITRNTRIGREWVPVDYDVFVPKIVSLINNKKIPSALQSRCLIINLLRALPDQELVEVDPFNDELMEQFKTLKRKLTRWANDNITALKTTAAPIYPANLRTRQKNNAKLLLSIAELAGPEWAETARPALDRILREEREPSWRERLLQELWTVFFEEKLGKAIESGELIKRLITDPTSEWCNYQGKSRHPNQWDIGALLTPIGIRSRQVGKRRLGGYHLKDFLENQIFERWLSRRPLNLSPEKKSKRVSRPRRKKPNRSCKTRG